MSNFQPPADLAAIKAQALGLEPVEYGQAGAYQVNRAYWHPLPAPLAAWFVYVDQPQIGCRILAVADEDEFREPIQLRAVPVKTLLRYPWWTGQANLAGYIVTGAPTEEVGPHPGDPFGPSERAIVCSADDIEYRPTPATWCKHFTGVSRHRCNAGVVYHDISGGGFGSALKLPCIASNHIEHADILARCSKLDWDTQEELAAHEAAMDAAVDQIALRSRLGLCVECGQRPTHMRQVHSSFFAEPCGHRQGVGSAAAWNRTHKER